MVALVLRRAVLPLLLALVAGCLSRGRLPESPRLAALQEGAAEERDLAFQQLLWAESPDLPALLAGRGIGARAGFPVVALLYAAGEGDAVPLDLRARHLAGFRWPPAFAESNAVVAPFVSGQVEEDLVRAGRPAVAALAEALAEDASTEAGAVRAARALLRIGGRAACDALSELVKRDRAAGDVRIGDVAAAALLVAGRQEALLRISDAEARRAAAAAWWADARDQPEEDWIASAAAALAVSEWRDEVLDLLVGKRIDEPRAWKAESPGWRPSPPPLRPETLLGGLEGGRAEAYRANALLERATGARVWTPPWSSVEDLRRALSAWAPPPDLAVRWGRWLRGPMLRLSVAVVGRDPAGGTNRIRWAHESWFHPLEKSIAELRFDTAEGSYQLFVQARDLGLKRVMSESFGEPGSWSVTTQDWVGTGLRVHVSETLKSVVLVAVDESSERRPPRPAESVRPEWRERLREAAARGGPDAPALLRALGYFQESKDAEFLRERGAGEALLLVGDPSGVERQPVLESWELEMALRKAEDPGLKAYLESFRDATRK